MEQNNLVIAINVPYEVEISATGIPLHQSKVEFCIHREDVRYSFPTKMINDNKFIFTITDDVSSLLNSTLEYRLYVYYGNARFEADIGTFNFIDKDVFDVKMKKDDSAPKVTPIDEELLDKLDKSNTPSEDKNVEESLESSTILEEQIDEEPIIITTEPIPTLTITPMLTAKDAKKALRNIIKEKEIKREVKKNQEILEEDTEDYNQKIKDILEDLSKKVAPSIELEATPSDDVRETQTSDKLVEEVDNIEKTLLSSLLENKKIRDGIWKTTNKKA